MSKTIQTIPIIKLSKHHKQVINMNEKLTIILTRLQLEFKNLYGERLVKMILFGSQARGDADFGSDIDILVVLKGLVNSGEEIKKTSYIVADLSLQYDEVVNCLFINENQLKFRNSPLLRNIRKEGILL